MSTRTFAARLLMVGGLAAGLAACESASTDPHEGGILGGMKGLSSGEYERRVEEKEDRLASVEALNRDLEDENADLNAEGAAQDKRLKAAKRKVRNLEKELAQLETQVKTKSAATTAASEQRVEILEKLTDTRRDLAALEKNQAGGGMTVAEYEAEYKRLDAMAKELEGLYEALR